jgi:hypothetical protein
MSASSITQSQVSESTDLPSGHYKSHGVQQALTLGLPTLLDVIICCFPYADTNCPHFVNWATWEHSSGLWSCTWVLGL